MALVMRSPRLLLACLLLGASPTVCPAGPPKPVKVFVLAGQSNMEGQAVVDLDGKDYNDGKGTLNALFFGSTNWQASSGITGGMTVWTRRTRSLSMSRTW